MKLSKQKLFWITSALCFCQLNNFLFYHEAHEEHEGVKTRHVYSFTS